jgi:hypothetical protein
MKNAPVNTGIKASRNAVKNTLNSKIVIMRGPKNSADRDVLPILSRCGVLECGVWTPVDEFDKIPGIRIKPIGLHTREINRESFLANDRK